MLRNYTYIIHTTICIRQNKRNSDNAIRDHNLYDTHTQQLYLPLNLMNTTTETSWIPARGWVGAGNSGTWEQAACIRIWLCYYHLCPLPDSAVRGIFKARILEQVAISSSDLPHPGIKPAFFESPALAGRFFTTVPSGKPPSDPTFHLQLLICKMEKQGN